MIEVVIQPRLGILTELFHPDTGMSVIDPEISSLDRLPQARIKSADSESTSRQKKRRPDVNNTLIHFPTELPTTITAKNEPSGSTIICCKVYDSIAMATLPRCSATTEPHNSTISLTQPNASRFQAFQHPSFLFLTPSLDGERS
jgi:hypothetical protein